MAERIRQCNARRYPTQRRKANENPIPSRDWRVLCVSSAVLCCSMLMLSTTSVLAIPPTSQPTSRKAINQDAARQGQFFSPLMGAYNPPFRSVGGCAIPPETLARLDLLQNALTLLQGKSTQRRQASTLRSSLLLLLQNSRERVLARPLDMVGLTCMQKSHKHLSGRISRVRRLSKPVKQGYARLMFALMERLRVPFVRFLPPKDRRRRRSFLTLVYQQGNLLLRGYSDVLRLGQSPVRWGARFRQAEVYELLERKLLRRPEPPPRGVPVHLWRRYQRLSRCRYTQISRRAIAGYKALLLQAQQSKTSNRWTQKAKQRQHALSQRLRTTCPPSSKPSSRPTSQPSP